MAWRELAARVAAAVATLPRRVIDLAHRIYWDLRDTFSRPRKRSEPRTIRLRVLFVCTGNICRSPLAEEVFRHMLEVSGLAATVGVDSAGTSAWNVGKRPHWRARACAARHGLTLGPRRARQLTAVDLQSFDRVLVMDQRNRDDVARLASHGHDGRTVRLLLDFAGGGEIQDPVNGGTTDFERTFRQIGLACEGLLADVAREVGHHSGDARAAAPP